MFCSKCGTRYPDGEVCPNCYQSAAAPAVQPMPQYIKNEKNEAIRAWFAPVSIVLAAVVSSLLDLLSNYLLRLGARKYNATYYALSYFTTFVSTLIVIGIFLGFSAIAFIGCKKKKEKALGLTFAIPMVAYFLSSAFSTFASYAIYYLRLTLTAMSLNIISYILLAVFTLIAAIVSFFITYVFIKKKTN